MPCPPDCVHVKCTCDRHEEYTYYEDFVWVQFCHCEAQLHDSGGFSMEWGSSMDLATRFWTPWSLEKSEAYWKAQEANA